MSIALKPKIFAQMQAEGEHIEFVWENGKKSHLDVRTGSPYAERNLGEIVTVVSEILKQPKPANLSGEEAFAFLSRVCALREEVVNYNQSIQESLWITVFHVILLVLSLSLFSLRGALSLAELDLPLTYLTGKEDKQKAKEVLREQITMGQLLRCRDKTVREVIARELEIAPEYSKAETLFSSLANLASDDRYLHLLDFPLTSLKSESFGPKHPLWSLKLLVEDIGAFRAALENGDIPPGFWSFVEPSRNDILQQLLSCQGAAWPEAITPQQLVEICLASILSPPLAALLPDRHIDALNEALSHALDAQDQEKLARTILQSRERWNQIFTKKNQNNYAILAAYLREEECLSCARYRGISCFYTETQWEGILPRLSVDELLTLYWDLDELLTLQRASYLLRIQLALKTTFDVDCAKITLDDLPTQLFNILQSEMQNLHPEALQHLVQSNLFQTVYPYLVVIALLQARYPDLSDIQRIPTTPFGEIAERIRELLLEDKQKLVAACSPEQKATHFPE